MHSRMQRKNRPQLHIRRALDLTAAPAELQTVQKGQHSQMQKQWQLGPHAMGIYQKACQVKQ